MKKVIKTNKDLRKFGLTIATAFFVFSAVLWWREKSYYPFLLLAALLFLLPALAFPRVLAPIERAWMKVAELIGAVMTRVILVIAFFLVITPAGLLRRLFTRDPLRIRFDNDRMSYWDPVEPDGPGTRPEKPY